MWKGAEDSGGRRRSAWRIAPWITAALALLLPLAAMQVTDKVAWSGGDFALLGAMLFGARGAYELGARRTGNAAYRAALATALATALGLIWITLAVGIIGPEGDPANLMYFGVLALGLLGAFMVRFRPGGMARVLGVTAIAQAATGIIALIAGLGSSGANWPGVVVVLTGVFVLLWLASAWLFRRAAREPMIAAAPS